MELMAPGVLSSSPFCCLLVTNRPYRGACALTRELHTRIYLRTHGVGAMHDARIAKGLISGIFLSITGLPFNLMYSKPTVAYNRQILPVIDVSSRGGIVCSSMSTPTRRAIR